MITLNIGFNSNSTTKDTSVNAKQADKRCVSTVNHQTVTDELYYTDASSHIPKKEDEYETINVYDNVHDKPERSTMYEKPDFIPKSPPVYEQLTV